MNEMEEQLSRLFHATVGEPPRQVTLGAIRRQVIRRRIIAAVTVTGAITVAGSIGLAVAADAAGPKAPPAVTTGSAARPPKFYITSAFGHDASAPQVRATATGAVTGQVRCPLPKTSESSLAAQASNRTFFMTCVRVASQDTVIGTRIYRFSLTSTGRPSALSLVRGGVLSRDEASEIATSANGSLVAVIVRLPRRGSRPEIVVINTRTGRHAVWSDQRLPGSPNLSPSNLSFADNGRVLAVFGSVFCPKSDSQCKSAGEEMLALSPAAKGGEVSSGRVIFTQSQVGRPSDTFINDAYLAPNGSTVTLSLLGDGPPPDSVSVVQVSAATGKPLRVLYRLGTGNGFSYGFVHTDGSGRFVLFNAGPTKGEVFGWINQGKLVKLKPGGASLFDGAW
jgi:hypothetical protein